MVVRRRQALRPSDIEEIEVDLAAFRAMTAKFNLPVGRRRRAPSGHILVIAGHRRCGSNVARATESPFFPLQDLTSRAANSLCPS